MNSESMDHLRIYGAPPYATALLHGGPGAAGEMAPIAEELAAFVGVLEPLQTADSVDGQIEELKSVLDRAANPPICLTGFSWGAMLAFLFAARFPAYIRKLILVGSGPFEENYAGNIMNIRLGRLSGAKRGELKTLIEILDDPAVEDKDSALAAFGTLMAETDAYDPVSAGEPVLRVNYDIYRKVWREAWELRRSGRLLEFGREIRCPVVAIHGDYDPHPAAGVHIPLSGVLKDFRFVPLKKCGHRPWLEKKARAEFYDLLKKELLS